MSTTSKNMLRRISQVTEADDRLRRVLLDNPKANVELAELIGSGEFGMTALINVMRPSGVGS